MRNGAISSHRDQLSSSHNVPLIELSHIDNCPSQYNMHSTCERLSPSFGFDMWESGEDESDEVSQIETDLIHQMPSLSLAKDLPLGINEDSDLSKQIDTVRRNQWMSLKEKRRKKAELVETDNRRSEHTIGILRVAKYSISMSLQKFWETLQGFAYTCELWYSDLKLIEGNFGSGMAAYFKFLRWLFLLNCAMMFISCSFLVVPQILSRFFVNVDGNEYENGVQNTTGSNETMSVFVASFMYKSSPYEVNSNFSIDDLFTGEGFLTQTSLYYGYYSNQTIELVKGYSYNIPNAYFFSLFVCYLLFFIIVSSSMARSYRTSFIETKGGQKNVCALKVFCGWDFSIATSQAAALNHKHIYNDIKEVLNETVDQDQDYSFCSLFTNVLIHMSLNAIFTLLLTGIGFLMWDFLGRHSLYYSETSSQNNETGTRNTMTMSIFISIIMNVFPKGFSWIVRYEGYRSPRTALYVTLLRTFMLNCVVIGVLLVFWVTNSHSGCWQTSLGQEIYRLVITDFIVSILILEVFQVIWSWLSKRYFEGSSYPEFDIAWNSLNLIYNQTLLLVGLYFSPLLVVVVILKIFVTFYIKKAEILFNAEASKSWRAAQTQTVFLILIFITTLGVFLLLAYVLIEVPPSSCGPFQGNESTYRIVLDSILQLENDHIFWKVVMFLVKPGIVAAVLVAMSAATFILSTIAQSNAISAKVLREMVISESKDKAFLFKCIRSLEKAGYKKGSPVSSSSSFSHTPLSERKMMKKRLRDRNNLKSFFPSRVLADSSVPPHHESDSPRGSMGSRGVLFNISQTMSSGTSMMTQESECPEFDRNDGHHLY